METGRGDSFYPTYLYGKTTRFHTLVEINSTSYSTNEGATAGAGKPSKSYVLGYALSKLSTPACESLQ